MTEDTSLLVWQKSAKGSLAARRTIVLEIIPPTSPSQSNTGTNITPYRLAGVWPEKIEVTGSNGERTIKVTFVALGFTHSKP